VRRPRRPLACPLTPKSCSLVGWAEPGCAGSAPASWLRELTPSLANTFRRW
jgi:hypothetical protein